MRGYFEVVHSIKAKLDSSEVRSTEYFRRTSCSGVSINDNVMLSQQQQSIQTVSSLESGDDSPSQSVVPVPTAADSAAATATTKVQATPEMCFHCFDTLINTLVEQNCHQKLHNQQQQRQFLSGLFGGADGRSHDQKKQQQQQQRLALPCSTVPIFIDQLPDASTETPIFVTWDKNENNSSQLLSLSPSWKLRGCIGNLSPRLLADAVGEYAIISAMKDRRFKPVQLHEVESLRCSVSLLINYEECQHVYDWTVGSHGIMIKFYAPSMTGQYYNATYLPEVAPQQGWDRKKTVSSLIQKAGYYGPLSTELIDSIQCTRYQSSKCSITYQEYIKMHCDGQNPLVVVSTTGPGSRGDSGAASAKNGSVSNDSNGGNSDRSSSCNIA